MEVSESEGRLAEEGSEMSLCLGQRVSRWGSVDDPQTPGRMRSAIGSHHGTAQEIRTARQAAQSQSHRKRAGQHHSARPGGRMRRFILAARCCSIRRVKIATKRTPAITHAHDLRTVGKAWQ